MSKQTIFRDARPESGYTKLSNQLLQCKTVSLEARGFQAFFLSQKHDWRFNMVHARREFGIGEQKAERIMKELQGAGFARKSQGRNPDGTMGPVVYEFTDVPFTFATDRSVENRAAVDRSVKNREAVNQPPYKENTVERNKEETDIPQQVAVCADFSEGTLFPPKTNEGPKLPTFDQFWKAYPNKRGKADARKLWNMLSDEARIAALEKLPLYLRTDAVKRGAVRDGDRYLKSRTWEDFDGATASGEDPDKIAQEKLRVAHGYKRTGFWSNACANFWHTINEMEAWLSANAPMAQAA